MESLISVLTANWGKVVVASSGSVVGYEDGNPGTELYNNSVALGSHFDSRCIPVDFSLKGYTLAVWLMLVLHYTLFATLRRFIFQIKTKIIRKTLGLNVTTQ